MNTHIHAYHTSDGDGAHSIVDHTACEVGQQDAGGGQEHPSHCCTVLHQHCHSTGVLTTDHWNVERSLEGVGGGTEREKGERKGGGGCRS